jgi:hypothetical protein
MPIMNLKRVSPLPWHSCSRSCETDCCRSTACWGGPPSTPLARAGKQGWAQGTLNCPLWPTAPPAPHCRRHNQWQRRRWRRWRSALHTAKRVRCLSSRNPVTQHVGVVRQPSGNSVRRPCNCEEQNDTAFHRGITTYVLERKLIRTCRPRSRRMTSQMRRSVSDQRRWHNAHEVAAHTTWDAPTNKQANEHRHRV